MEQLMREKVARWARLMVTMTLGLMVRLDRRLPTANSWPRRRRITPNIQRSRKICVRKKSQQLETSIYFNF